MQKRKLSLAASIMANWILGRQVTATPEPMLPTPPGIETDRNHYGARIFTRDNSVFNTSKYQPHQGKKECTRRIKQGAAA